MWSQTTIQLAAKPRGFHLITDELIAKLPELSAINTGLVHLLLQHTSASLTLNENADPTVRTDMENYFSTEVAEDTPYFQHTYEGPDDMPAHIKSSMLGVSLHLPITNGRLNLGTWQGVYLGEHRNHGGSRTIVATIMGQ